MEYKAVKTVSNNGNNNDCDYCCFALNCINQCRLPDGMHYEKECAKKKVELICAVDNEDNYFQVLLAYDNGMRPSHEMVSEAIYKYLGEYQRDVEESSYKLIIDRLCHCKPVVLLGHTFFFRNTTIYI